MESCWFKVIYLISLLLIRCPFPHVKKEVKIKKAGCELMRHPSLKSFLWPSLRTHLSHKWHKVTSWISTPPKTAEGLHFHVWHDTKISSYIYLLMEKLLGFYFQFFSLAIMQHSVTRVHLFLHPQDDRSSFWETIGVHSMQDRTATRHGVTRKREKEAQKD